MDFDFSIHFGKSSSSDYDKAVEYAAMFERFTPNGHGSHQNVVHTSNHEVLTQYDHFRELMNLIGDWDSAGVAFRNTKVNPARFSLDIKDIAECYLGYMKEPNKAEYCDNKTPGCWGCRQLNEIVLHHSGSPYSEFAVYWYQFGSFSDKTTWRINKEKITQALEEIIVKKSIDFCPTFQHLFFRKFVAALPTFIDMSDTEHWGYIYLDESLLSAPRWEAISIYHITSFSAPAKDSKAPGKNAERIKVTDSKNLRYIPETSFADIGGMDEIIQNIRTVIELPFKKPELYDYLGVKPYRGILLWGEPGNGKTLIAKAIAHDVKAHFIPVIGPDILNKNFGESEKNLREIFEEAREFQPAVIFIDEIDSIAQTRLAGESSQWYATVVNQLMSLMDGIKEFGNVSVLASTNRPDLLDNALLRPGRFDYKLEIKKPNLPGCKKVLEIATRGMPLANDVDLFTFAESVVGYSAAEVTFIAKEAAMVALRKAIDIKSIIIEDNVVSDFFHLKVTMADFKSALHVLKWNRRYINMTYSLKG